MMSLMFIKEVRVILDNNKTTGIYKIVNLINGKFYIGSASQSFNKRWNKHKSELNRNIHKNNHLQHAWNKYGGENFDFIIIEEVLDIENILNIEQKYLDELKPDYNICCFAGSTKGLYLSDETKQKISEKLSGENNPMYGKKHTDKSKLKMKKKHLGIHGEKHPRSKLTQHQVDEIRKMKSDGVKQIKIAKIFGVTKDTISRILRGCTCWS